MERAGAPGPLSSAAEITRSLFQHRSCIFGYLMAHTGNYYDAEDLFQDICAHVFERISEFQPGTNFKAWVMAITRYRILSYYKGTSDKRKLLRLTPEIAESMAENRIGSEDEKPEVAALRNCLKHLTGKKRDLILGRFGMGLSCQEVARSVGWTPHSVYVALSRLKDALEECVRGQLSSQSPA
jgi:RNA polymerase sigma-70 factor (ECF subfamily)